MRKLLERFAGDISGATAIEYALIGTIVGIGIIASLTSFRDGLSTLFASVTAALAN